MDIRISSHRAGAAYVVKVDGALTAGGLPELERTAAGLDVPLTVDLSDLRAADEEGIQALRRLRAAGAELVGASPYMALRIGTVPDGK
jgi:hypothetical protein